MNNPANRPLWKRLHVQLFGANVAIFVVAAFVLYHNSRQPGSPADYKDARLVETGRSVYAKYCSGCHGAKLEGQPNWKVRLPNGRMPPPPHDESGHTWHHPDRVLFGIVKYGVTPPYGPPGYQSDMPAFGSTLTDDEIRAALAFIKSRWPDRVLQWRSEMLKNSGGDDKG